MKSMIQTKRIVNEIIDPCIFTVVNHTCAITNRPRNYVTHSQRVSFSFSKWKYSNFLLESTKVWVINNNILNITAIKTLTTTQSVFLLFFYHCFKCCVFQGVSIGTIENNWHRENIFCKFRILTIFANYTCCNTDNKRLTKTTYIYKCITNIRKYKLNGNYSHYVCKILIASWRNNNLPNFFFYHTHLNTPHTYLSVL